MSSVRSVYEIDGEYEFGNVNLKDWLTEGTELSLLIVNDMPSIKKINSTRRSHRVHKVKTAPNCICVIIYVYIVSDIRQSPIRELMSVK